MKKVNESGRSMVEMLGVLAIIGVLSVGGIAGYSKAMNKYKLNKVNDQMSMLIANLRTMFATQTDYSGLSNLNARKFGIVPSDMYSGKASADSNVTNPYSGKVEIAPTKYNGVTNRAFYVSQSGIPKDACVSIATADWGSDVASGFIGMTIAADTGNGSTKVSGAADAKDAVCQPTNVGGSTEKDSCRTPLSVMDATTLCAGNNNSIIWYYY